MRPLPDTLVSPAVVARLRPIYRWRWLGLAHHRNGGAKPAHPTPLRSIAASAAPRRWRLLAALVGALLLAGVVISEVVR